MICLMLLASAFIYFYYNANKVDSHDAYCLGMLLSGVPALFILIAAFTGGISSSCKFEAQKETRKILEYQIARPIARDDNFFEQLSEYNSTIIENQAYNKDWFLNGICISDKWDTIEPLTFGETK